jgi:hypothetical protein
MAKTAQKPSSGSSKRSPDSGQSLSFFNRFLSILGMEPDPDRERKTLLKEIKLTLKRSRDKLYQANGDLVDVGLAKALHEIYVVVGPVNNLMQNAVASNALKGIFIEHFLSEPQKALQIQLTEDAIHAASASIPPEQLTTMFKDMLNEFSGALEADIQRKIDTLYNLFLVFVDFISFNYYFMLRKFDSGLPEGDFSYKPRFEALNGEYVLEDLKDFLTAAGPINPAADWESLFDVLKTYKGMDVVSRANWKKMMTSFGALKNSGQLLFLTQVLADDPFYKVRAVAVSERVVEPYLSQLRTQVESTLQKITQDKRNDKLSSLVQQIFNTTVISRTKGYTEKSNIAYQKKRMVGFTLVEPVNYLKAFMLDCFKRDIRELVNLLLVKGQWVSNAIAQPLSDSFHHLMELSDQLTAFDDALAEDTEKGKKLGVLLAKSDKDPNSAAAIKQQLKEVNAGARAFILEGANHLIVVGKHLKMAIDDYAKAKPELLLNWKQIEGSTQKILREWMPTTYKQIYNFVQLMQFFVKENAPKD